MGEYKDSTLQMIFCVTLMGVIGVSLISPAFPIIRDAFGLSVPEVGFLVTVFTLPGIIFSPIIGIISDRKGRKPLLIASLIIFGAAGGLIIFVNSFFSILLLRFFQGCAAAGLSTLSLALIADAYEGDRRATVMGYNGSVLSIGTASYPFIGGILAVFGWKYPFYLFFIAIPIGLVLWRFLDAPQVLEKRSFKLYFTDILDEAKQKRLLIALLAGVVTFVLLYGSYLTFFTQFLSNDFGADAFTIGIILSFMSISTAIFSSKAGAIIKTFGLVPPIITGFLLYGVGLTIMLFMDSIWLGLVAVFIYGAGQGLNLPALQIYILHYVRPEAKGAISSFYSSTLRIGQSIGPIAMGILYSSGGFSLVFIGSIILAISMGAILLFFWISNTI